MQRFLIQSPQVIDTQRRILEAATQEVIERGVLGLRVAKVAADANCSITSMYRYFGSRDGLLAEVLLQLYEQSFEAIHTTLRERLGGTRPLTEEDVIECIPLPRGEIAQRDHAVRSQVLAVAATNPILRSKLSESLTARRLMLSTIMDDIEGRLPAGVTIDREVVSVFIFNINWQYNDLLGDWAVGNEQYRALLRRLMFKR
jgi:AcrR family transcriptional regulator